jgi:hypothetical protein
MSTIIIVLILLIICTIWFAITIVYDLENVKPFSFSFTWIMVLLFLLTSIKRDVRVSYEKVDVQIFKTPTCIIISDSIGIREIHEYSKINKIDSTTIWYREHTVNLWNQKNIENLVSSFEISN